MSHVCNSDLSQSPQTGANQVQPVKALSLQPIIDHLNHTNNVRSFMKFWRSNVNYMLYFEYHYCAPDGTIAPLIQSKEGVRTHLKEIGHYLYVLHCDRNYTLQFVCKEHDATNPEMDQSPQQRVVDCVKHPEAFRQLALHPNPNFHLRLTYFVDANRNPDQNYNLLFSNSIDADRKLQNACIVQYRNHPEMFRNAVSYEQNWLLIQSVIDRLSSYKFTNPSIVYEQPECKLCFFKFEPNERVRLLPCLHRFHKECIDEWVRRHRSCPFCHETKQLCLRMNVSPI